MRPVFFRPAGRRKHAVQPPDSSAPPPHAPTPAASTAHAPEAPQLAGLEASVHKLENTVRRFYRLAVMVVTVTAAGLFVSSGGAVVMVVFASALVAVVLHAVARIISRLLHIPQWLSVMLFVLVLVGALSLVVHVSGPELTVQLSHLHEALTSERDALHNMLDSNPLGHAVLDHFPRFLGGNMVPDGRAGSEGGMDFAGSMTNVLTSTFGSVGTMVVIIIAGVYFALSPHLYANGILRITPVAYRSTMRTVLLTTGHALTAWVAGQMLDMTVVGMLTWSGLSLLGMPLALPLGLVAGLANFVPYLGTFIGAVPALLIALSVGPREAMMVAGLYAAIQTFEGYVMSPFIQKRAVRMPPALTILSQTIFGAFLGMWGFIFASPITAVLLAVASRLSAPLPPNEEV
ncbi:AI-2E family transporter [Acetobacter sp. DmW_136]|uniref:AI-2E family transporter n=1 Tax=Acetobacter sp. DmW_136 TaxID=2591091 RepID=UPI00123A08B3|nr:AI-2E family transporter [Acetobacter sp. DmW_136]